MVLGTFVPLVRGAGGTDNTLGQLGRNEEAIAVYDDVVGRFGTATELPLLEEVARALVNKGVTLGQLGRNEEAIGGPVRSERGPR